MFRVAVFSKENRRQEFKCFRCGGYWLNNKGVLYKNKQKVNVSDKRKKNYYELNKYVGREDINGVPLYAKDIVLYKPENIIGLVDWNDRRSAFVVYLQRDYFKIPYTLLKCQDRSLVKLGNVYENFELLNNRLKRS